MLNKYRETIEDSKMSTSIDENFVKVSYYFEKLTESRKPILFRWIFYDMNSVKIEKKLPIIMAHGFYLPLIHLNLIYLAKL